MNLTLKQWLELFEDGGCTEALRSRSAQIVEMIRSRTGNSDRLLSIQSEDDIKDIFYDRLCDIYIGCFTELLSLEMGEGDGAYRIKWCPQEGYADIIDTIYESFLMGIRLLHEHYPNNVILINKG